MNRLVLSENQIMDFDLIAQKSVQDYFDTNYLIYFLLDGETDFFVGNNEFLLKTKDFILVESCRHHGYRAKGHILMARFIISLEILSKFYDIHKMEIACNSTAGAQEQYSQFRKLLERCIGNYHGKQAGDGRSLIRLNSIYYQIIEQLISHFANYEPDEISSGENHDSERVNDIISYIHSNFKHQITLNDLAERMYLSTAYVSRYIKKKLGKNLVEYLTDIRLDSAVRDLESSDKTIARIALDNGFPNVSSFNKAFKERYQATPKRYQENYIASNKAGDDDFQGEISHHLMDYMEHREDAITKYEELRRTLDADTEKYRFLTKNWNRMINIGRAVTLLRSDVQQHVIYLKQSLNVEYIRIWDLYDESLQLNIGSVDGKHNFSKLDKIIDFLLDNKLRPYMELGFKPIILLDAYNSFISYQEREILFQDYIEYGRFLESMVIHFVNRYGAYEVSQWIFEQWCDPRLFSEENADNYFRTFDMAYNAIKNVVPEIRIGGAYDRSYGFIKYDHFIQLWANRSIQPDFLSIYCYRSRGEEIIEGEESYQYESQKADFLKKYLLAHKERMRTAGMNIPVYVSEWNFTVVNRNVLNDSCFKGAYVMKNLMELYGEAELIGYWFGTDLLVECEEAPKILDGCCGLISYHAIRKPAFYAIEFMNRLGNYLLAQSENAMVTADGYDNYYIVCHNYKHMDVQYFLQDEKNIQIKAIPFLFPDDSRLKLNIRIDHVKNGFYNVKTRSVSAKNGSIQDEWQRMGFTENLNAQDIEYLRGICVPRISIYEYSVKNNTLELNLSMDPQEIQCIHIFRQLKE